MSFTSAAFLILFFPVCVLGNYFINEKYRNTFLCLASLVFYAWCGIRFLILMMVMSLIDYGLGLLLGKKTSGHRKLLLIVGLAVNIGTLCYYKYLFDILTTITSWIPVGGGYIGIMAESPALPLGLSFYTFSLISYLMDVYWRRCPAQRRFGALWLYVAFFPKVVQGPIMKYADFEKQLHGRTVDLAGMNEGLERFIKGMFKKVMIADQLNGLVTYSFSNIAGVGTIPAWISVICYMLQLYYDFSGYSDMAVGLGRMVGFTLPENFKHPYTSTSVVDYWRRWHASLGEWFREYVYMPCARGLTRKRWIKRLKDRYAASDVIALIVTWTLTGIWHGSGLQFLLFGLWNCLFVLAERSHANKRKKLKKEGKLTEREPSFWRKAGAHVGLLAVLVVSSVLFRADSVKTAGLYLSRLLIWNTRDGILMLHQFNNYTLVFLVVGVVFTMPVYESLKAKLLSACRGQGAKTAFWLVYRLGLAAAFLVAFSYAVSNGYSSFLYEVF